MTMRWKLYWLIVALTLAIYATMITRSLPYIAGQARGKLPFDMRSTGSTRAEAQAFLTALSDQGRLFFLTTQHRLDLIYPALRALVLTGAGRGLTQNGYRPIAFVIGFAAFLGAGANFTGNIRVAAMLRAAPEALDAALVESARFATLIKSATTTVAMVLVLGLLAPALIRRFRKGASA